MFAERKRSIVHMCIEISQQDYIWGKSGKMGEEGRKFIHKVTMRLGGMVDSGSDCGNGSRYLANKAF